MLHSIEYITGIPRLSTFASEIRIDFLIRVSSSMFQYLTHLFESFGSFCHPVFGQVLGSPSINVLKFNIH